MKNSTIPHLFPPLEKSLHRYLSASNLLQMPNIGLGRTLYYRHLNDRTLCHRNNVKCSPTCFIVAGCRASSHAWDGLGPARPGAGGRRPPYAAGRGGSTPGSSRRPGPSWRRTRGASTSTRTRPRMPAASPSTGRGRSRWPMT